MLSLIKKHYYTIVIVLLLSTSVIGMLFFKELLENSRQSYANVTNSQYSVYETYFSVFKYLLILTVGYLIFSWFFNRYREFKQLKNEKTKAELQLLKSQINPHFFFNTLNNLYGLTVEKSDDAPDMILKLSEMMRYTIYEGKDELVSLKNEVLYLKNYVELHKIRHQKKVNISFDENVNHEHKVAPLLFIILLENAFKHGVNRLTEDALINIKLKTNNNSIVFSVENNFEIQKKKVESGIGLDNLKRRLKLIYPKKHNLIIEKQESIYKATLELQIA